MIHAVIQSGRFIRGGYTFIMTHYVCPECGGVADHPKVCETPGCKHAGQELVACNCTDGLHAEVKNKGT
jgi:hypothetical protein